MPANSALRVTDINFNGIKQNLRTYLSSQSELQDYDYDSSTLQTLLNLLAYNTYYNAFYTNMIANEMYLDSAIIRSNVVSRAKMLGYMPNSARGATATVRVTIVPNNNPKSITIPANTTFTSSIDGVTYSFASQASKIVTADANGNFVTSLDIKEGDPVEESYTVNSTNPVRYFLSNLNADTTTLKVQVQESSSNTVTTNFRLASDLLAVNSSSYIYFLQESDDQKYEVIFGDGVLGRTLRNSNVVRLNYQVCNGPITNGANNFVGPVTIGGYNNYSFTVPGPARGGTEQESIDSIKFNAPKNFQTQNRAVTSTDYKNILYSEAPDLAAVSTWGGEENSPPIYGKVFVCAKPIVGNIVSDQRKTELVSLLSSKNVLSIEPEFVDATFLYVVPKVETRYNPNGTTLSASNILNRIINKIVAFENKELNKFETTFYYSQLLKQIDEVDPSIIGSRLDILMQKRFIPTTNASTSYIINFNNPIYNPYSGYRFAISSSSFTFNGFECFFDDDGSGNLRIYRLVQGNRTYVNRSAGVINYPNGTITFKPLLITAFSGDGIKINAAPKEVNVSTIRNQILLFADASVSVIDKDTNITVAQSIEPPATNKTTSSSDVGLNDNSLVF